MSSSNRMLRLAFFWGGSVMLLAPIAAADPLFPEQLAKELSMPCIPSCTVCHLDTKGGYGTLRPTTKGERGFGLILRDDYGLNVTEPKTSLKPAVQAAETAKSDADSDGVPDIDELKQGTDPNDAANARSLCGPEFGCVRVARRGPIDNVASVASAAVLVLGFAALRRSRAR